MHRRPIGRLPMKPLIEMAKIADGVQDVRKSPIKKLREMPRPAGYVDAVRACAIKVDRRFYWVDWASDCGQELLRRYRPDNETEAERLTAYDRRIMRKSTRRRWLARRWWGRAWLRHAGPGDVFAAALFAATGGMVRLCATCSSRKTRMNNAGWPWGWFLLLWPWFWSPGFIRPPRPAVPAPGAG